MDQHSRRLPRKPPQQPHTLRMYAGAQRKFLEWCAERDIQFPASHGEIGQYLSESAKQYSPKTATFRMSAIAHLYRRSGLPFDTKHPDVQVVVRRIRRAAADR